MRGFKHLFIISLSICTLAVPGIGYCQANKKSGVIIPDNDPFTNYTHTELVQSTSGNHTESILLDKDLSSGTAALEAIFNTWKLPYRTLSKSPTIISTDWLLWHYDKESNKTYSKPENSFFSLNVRDRYRFKLIVKSHDDKTRISIQQVKREQEKDITPSSTMIWLKWLPLPENERAVHDFILRLQTAFETSAISEQKKNIVSNKKSAPVSSKQPGIEKNYISLNMPINAAWSKLILALSNKNITLNSVDSERHKISTKWLPVSYNKTDKTLVFKTDEQHKFKFIVTPGDRPEHSSIFIYNLKIKQGKKEKANSEQDKLAAKFLQYLQLEK